MQIKARKFLSKKEKKLLLMELNQTYGESASSLFQVTSNIEEIKTDKGNYLIETYAAPHEHKVVTEVFLEGRVVEIKEVPYESKISEDGIIRLIQKLQNSVIADLTNLFDLDEALRKKVTAEGLYKIGRLFS